MKIFATLIINNARFKLESKLVDSSNNKEVKQDHLKFVGNFFFLSFLILYLVRGNFYKSNGKVFHNNGNYHLGDTTYSGKEYLERNDNHTCIELRCSMILVKSSSQIGYDFVCERKNNKGNDQNNYNIISHLTLRILIHYEPLKLFDMKKDFTRTRDLANATLHSSLHFLILTYNLPI
ncbi:unnamed protein product [Rotaria sordida]|uniref:Uncharacterized protein n=1 Tax=Rotaria sordida TaxID=392033 RepID=A0A814I7J8_9BILA|nr:unnamed protein product [Rotaria sordida]CAF1131164.1 unnamed protein product [Rotaria sordida]